tara:strand:- start:477 stop:872 length:396 start_codon:yes stop_codon:yes gene_type:complete
MALTGKKYESFYVTTGSGADKVDSTKLTNATNAWAVETAEGCQKYVDDPILSPLIFQLQQMQDEIDYLRTEISANKDKVIPNVTGTANHAISFGALTATTVKGKTVYSVLMTVTDSSGAKAVVKTVILTLV